MPIGNVLGAWRIRPMSSIPRGLYANFMPANINESNWAKSSTIACIDAPSPTCMAVGVASDIEDVGISSHRHPITDTLKR
jgi:hypothetical protein